MAATAFTPAQTALVVDDNRQSADSLCQMLAALGLDARPVYGPRGALMALDHFAPGMVFLDINMPGLDGFEVQAFLRRDPRLAETPVIFVTSDDQPETERKIRQTGSLGVLVKPVSLEELEAFLKLHHLI